MTEAEATPPVTETTLRCPRTDARFDYTGALLASLIAGITPQNAHPEVDWGSPVGNEFGAIGDGGGGY